MSNSRIFCAAAFVAMGLLSALANHGVRFGTRPGWDEPSAFIVLSLALACAVVAMFGDRRPS